MAAFVAMFTNPAFLIAGAVSIGGGLLISRLLVTERFTNAIMYGLSLIGFSMGAMGRVSSALSTPMYMVRQDGIVYENQQAVALWTGEKALAFDENGQLVVNEQLTRMVNNRVSQTDRSEKIAEQGIVDTISSFVSENGEDASNCAVDNLAEIVKSVTGAELSDIAFQLIARDFALGTFRIGNTGDYSENTFISALSMQATLQAYGLTYNGYSLTQEEIADIIGSNENSNIILNLQTMDGIGHYVRITRKESTQH